MTNRKAQIPEATVLLATIIICITALSAVVSFTKITSDAVAVPKAVSVFDDSDKIQIYLADSAAVAMQGAAANALKRPVSCPGLVGNAVVWTEECKPNNQDIRNRIKQDFDRTFNGKFVSEGNSDSIIVKFLPIMLSESDQNKFISFNVTYSFAPNISISYPIIDFEETYSAAKSKTAECSDNSSCYDSFRLANWNVRVGILSSYYVFNLESKKSYFYDSSFKPVETSFALKK